MLPLMTAWHLHIVAKSRRYDTCEKYLQKTNEIYAKACEAIANDRVKAVRLARQELDKRYYEYGGKGPWMISTKRRVPNKIPNGKWLF